MQDQKKKLGRPKTGHALTPAQKQSFYRQRCAARTQELGKSVSFEYEVFHELKKAIEGVENRYPLRAGHIVAIERKAALYALEQLQAVLIDKSNVTKIYKQVDIEE